MQHNNNVYSLLILAEDTGRISFFPSKSGRAQPGQYDLPLSTEELLTPQIVKTFFKKMLLPEIFSGYEFKKRFDFEDEPINFLHSDELGEKNFVGYIVRVKRENILKTIYEKNEGQSFDPEVVQRGKQPYHFTELNVHAIKEFLKRTEHVPFEERVKQQSDTAILV